MKATINDLWDSYRQIIIFDGSEFDRPRSITDLKKCDNVLIGARIDGPKSPYEVMIDNDIYMVMPISINHPQGGKMFVLEIYNLAINISNEL